MRTREDDLLVLCYHAVSESWPAELSVTPAALEDQLALLLRRGYRPATFVEAVTARPVGPTLVVTFDDAFESTFTLARPLLARLGLTATVFVPTRQALDTEPMSWSGINGWLGGPHERELIGMSGDQLRQLDQEGWEIGAHSRTHPQLPRLDDEELADEVEGSRMDCERELGMPCRTFAYPYGAADGRVRAAVRAAGFTAAAGLSSDLSDASRFYWPRVGVYYADDLRRFHLKVWPAARRLRARPRVARVLAGAEPAGEERS